MNPKVAHDFVGSLLPQFDELLLLGGIDGEYVGQGDEGDGGPYGGFGDGFAPFFLIDYFGRDDFYYDRAVTTQAIASVCRLGLGAESCILRSAAAVWGSRSVGGP